MLVSLKCNKCKLKEEEERSSSVVRMHRTRCRLDVGFDAAWHFSCGTKTRRRRINTHKHRLTAQFLRLIKVICSHNETSWEKTCLETNVADMHCAVFWFCTMCLISTYCNGAFVRLLSLFMLSVKILTNYWIPPYLHQYNFHIYFYLSISLNTVLYYVFAMYALSFF